MTDAQDPDNGQNGSCPPMPPATMIELSDWGVIDPSHDINKIASVQAIKEAICRYGPIACSVNATTLMQNWKTADVFFETASDYSSPVTNHAVMIVGWDDSKNAWLMRNIWSTNWGVQGYCWINYKSNNIGRRACWVVVKSLPVINSISTPKDLEILDRYKIK